MIKNDEIEQIVKTYFETIEQEMDKTIFTNLDGDILEFATEIAFNYFRAGFLTANIYQKQLE